MTSLHYISIHIKHLWNNVYENLSDHPIIGYTSSSLACLLSFVYVPEKNALHDFALLIKDVGMLFGGALAILTFIVYIHKNFISKIKD